MKKILLFALICATMTLLGCEKDTIGTGEELAECAVNSTCELTLTNLSSNPYRMTVTGLASFDVPGNTTVTDIVLVCNRTISIRAEQLSGFLLFPTVVNGSSYRDECSGKNFIFP